MVILWLSLPGCARQKTRAAGHSPGPATDSMAPAPGDSEGIPTAVAMPVGADSSPRRLTIDTSLVVDQDVVVAARMTGIVEEIFVERGTRVKRGDQLLKLINRDLGLLLERAEIVARQRRADFERARRLHDEGTISPSQFEEIQLAHEAAAVDAEIAREELQKSFVRAPFDGLIIDRFARVGQKVIEDKSEPLFRLTTLGPLLARLYLPEDVARSLRQGDPVQVIPRYMPGVSAAGRIEWLSRVIDASSGTSQAIISVPGGGKAGGLMPGAAVTVVLSLPAAQAAALIPRSALRDADDASLPDAARVEVMEAGKRIWRKVRLGETRGDRVEVLEGLRPGETVVLNAGNASVSMENR